MNCSRCNKQGAKPYKYNNGGVITDVFLCDECFNLLSSGNNPRSRGEGRIPGAEGRNEASFASGENPVPARGRSGVPDPLNALASASRNDVDGSRTKTRNSDYRDGKTQNGRSGEPAAEAERGKTERVNVEEKVREKSAKVSDRSSNKNRSGSILGLETKCPTCGASFQEIKRTGYLGCADCFTFFKGRLEPIIDKFQGGVISNREKKQFEMTVMMLEHEYMSLSDRLVEGNSDRAVRRMEEIERRLAEMGVKVDV